MGENEPAFSLRCSVCLLCYICKAMLTAARHNNNPISVEPCVRYVKLDRLGRPYETHRRINSRSTIWLRSSVFKDEFQSCFNLPFQYIIALGKYTFVCKSTRFTMHCRAGERVACQVVLRGWTRFLPTEMDLGCWNSSNLYSFTLKSQITSTALLPFGSNVSVPLQRCLTLPPKSKTFVPTPAAVQTQKFVQNNGNSHHKELH